MTTGRINQVVETFPSHERTGGSKSAATQHPNTIIQCRFQICGTCRHFRFGYACTNTHSKTYFSHGIQCVSTILQCELQFQYQYYATQPCHRKVAWADMHEARLRLHTPPLAHRFDKASAKGGRSRLGRSPEAHTQIRRCCTRLCTQTSATLNKCYFKSDIFSKFYKNNIKPLGPFQSQTQTT